MPLSARLGSVQSLPPLARRQLLLGSFAAIARSAPPQLETLSQWLGASISERRAGVEACLERIGQLDASIMAWARLGPVAATGSGRLEGIPFGVKDIIETRDLGTEYGSAIYKGRRHPVDAAVVRDLRSRGAVVLGKTHTTAFAYRTPGPTRNPRNLAHTPGGSSSGSAAAVAAGMVPFALGTQTGGSVLRPASFCGITGFKPTYGLIPMEGVLPLAPSFDTLGFFTHTAADMLKLWECLGKPLGRDEDFAFGVPDPRPPVDKEMADAFEQTVALLRAAGVRLEPVRIAPMLADLDAAGRLAADYEGAKVHEQRYKEHGSRLDDVAELVRRGLQVTPAKYDEARGFIARSKKEIVELFARTPVILTPAAVGAAPSGLTSTGDPRMNRPWTVLGTPAISIPMPVKSGLPLGLQLTGLPGQDARVLRAAMRLEKILRS